MRTKVWFWTALLFTVYSLQTFAQTNWSTAVVGLERRVVRLEMAYETGETSRCSGVALNTGSGFVITAQHCVDGKLTAVTVNGRHAEVARQNKLLDLAVVRTEFGRDVEAMPLAAKTPPVGSDVAVIGFAWGSKRLHMQFGRVSLPLDDDGFLIIDGMAIGGDSGGPTVNAAGELVGITSRIYHNGPMHLSVMVPVERVREFVETYLPTKP